MIWMMDSTKFSLFIENYLNYMITKTDIFKINYKPNIRMIV